MSHYVDSISGSHEPAGHYTDLFVRREPNTKLDCPGIFSYQGVFICHSLEDLDRDLCMSMSTKEILSKKIYGHTAIPYGRYKMKWYDSPKHGRVPMLVGVKGFSFIEIHIANWAYQLEGCIAPGLRKGINSVEDSGKAFKIVKALIRDEKIEYINILKMTA